MKNLETIIKIMSTLGKEDQELLVEFKENSMNNKIIAKKIARKLFEQLPCIEQMRVLYFLSNKVSLDDVKSLDIMTRVVVAQNLILEDCKAETTFVDLEEDRSLSEEEAFCEDDFEEADFEEDYALKDFEVDRAVEIEAAELEDID